MQKFKQDGKVAVIISPGYGGGWSTDHDDSPEMLWDPGLVQLLLTKAKNHELETYIKLRYPYVNMNSVRELSVEWVPEGEQFYVENYDGFESIVTASDDNWYTA